MSYRQIIRQKPYEKILKLLRRDVITFIPQIFTLVILAGVEVGIYFLIKNLFPGLLLKNSSLAILYLVAFIYTLSIWLFFFTHFVDYFLDLWIVTNDRVIDIHQNGLFSRTIAELDLFRIQDVTSETKGIFGTICNFGNVYVQTAGEQQRFTFYNVPNPHQIREMLIRLADEDRKFHNADSIKKE
ncbi:MAG TPA: PH domain-containing protein [Candidatus Magasanikbacteria bacterium]|nr:PH domain-containing protein [Candidatus Magasanikbacteria bacterium]